METYIDATDSGIIISLGPRDIKGTEWIEEKLNSKVEANQRCGGVALYTVKRQEGALEINKRGSVTIRFLCFDTP